MTKEPADFNEAFQRLTREIKSQANSNEIISFDEVIREPFVATYAPTDSHALHDLGRVFSGDDNRSLFLRLDGPAIYLIVATVLQFPPSSMLSKIVFFFMDVLKLCVESESAQHTLAYLSRPFSQAELAKRQRTIFSQLIPRLKALLFDEDKHHKVRRLVAQLIIEICQQNAQGWRVLMEAQELLLFGDLFSQLNDYVLRLFVSDIVRHLLANNYEMHELWIQSSEDVMDFPSLQELDSETISRILHSMSALDAAKAFREEKHCRLYHVSDISISGLQYHSARSDTIIVVDDHLTLLMPDGGRNGTSFAAYEILITKEIFLENQQTSKRQTSFVKIRWRDNQGHVILRGKKKEVGEVRLQFLQHNNQSEFCKAFDNSFQRQTQHSWSSQSQQKPQTTPQLQSIIVNDREDYDADSGTRPESFTTERRSESLADENSLNVACNVPRDISSDLIIEDIRIPSDVFAFAHKNETPRRSLTALSKKLSKDVAGGTTPASLNTPRSSCDRAYLQTEGRSSPLKAYGRRGEETEVAMWSQMPARNPALTGALDQRDDVDYAAFVMTSSRANAASLASPLKRSGPRKRTHRAPSPEKVDHGLSQTELDAAHDKSIGSISKNSLSNRPVEGDELLARPRKKLKTTLSGTASKTSTAPVQPLKAAMAPANHHKGIQKPGVSQAKKAPLPAASKSTTSENVDWDEDLRTDDAEKKKQNTGDRHIVRAPPRRSLKDITNTTRAPTKDVQDKASERRKATTSSRRTDPSRSVSPVRRSQRITSNKAKSYAESPTSEYEKLQNESSEEEISRDTSLDSRRSSNISGVQKPTKAKKSQKRPPSKELPTKLSIKPGESANTLHHNKKADAVIVVPSSDDEDESESGRSAVGSAGPSSKQTKGQDPPSADTQTEKEIEVLGDSYPRHELGSEVPTTGSDRSFGTKLNDMIVGAPFGDPKQFIHNVNTAKGASSPHKRPSPTPPLQPATGLKPSEMAGTIDSAVAQQKLPERLEPYSDPSICDENASATRPHQDRFQLTMKLPCNLNVPESQIVDSKPSEVDVMGCDHNVSQAEKEAAQSEEHLLPAQEIVKVDEQQPSNGPSEFSKQGGSHLDVNRVSVQKSPSGTGDHTPTTDSAGAVIKPQHVFAAPSKTPRGLDSRASSRTLAKQKIASSTKLRAIASNKTQIVHFGNNGPLLPMQRFVERPTAYRSAQAEKQSRTSIPISSMDTKKRPATSDITEEVEHRQTVSGNEVPQNTDVDDTNPPLPIANRDDQQTRLAEEDEFHHLASDVDPARASEEPIAPSTSEIAAVKPDGSCRSSDLHDQYHEIASLPQPVPQYQASRCSSTTLGVVHQIIEPTTRESLQDRSDCVSSADIGVEIPKDSVSVGSKELLNTSQARMPTHESAIISTRRQDSHKNLQDIAHFKKPAALGIPRSEEKPALTAGQPDAQTSQDEIPTLPATRLPEVSTSRLPGKTFYTGHTPLLQVNTIARNIFENRNRGKSLSNHISSKKGSQPVTSDGFDGSEAFAQIEEPFKPAANSISTRNKVHTGTTSEISGNVLTHNHNNIAIAKATSLQVPLLEKALADKQQQPAYGSTETFNIVRVNRQDSPLAANSDTPVDPVSTPQAFLERLHAPTSPTVSTQSSFDGEKTFAPGKRLEPVQEEHTEERRPRPHSATPFWVHISKPRAPSSLVSTNNEENESILSQVYQHQSDTTRSASSFAFMVEDNMLEVVWKLADRIDAEEATIAKQVEAYHTGSVEILEDLRRNGSARIDHDASKLTSSLGEQRQYAAEAKAQLEKMGPMTVSFGLISGRIQQRKQHLYTMLNNIRP